VSAYTYRPRGKPLEIPTPGSNRRVAVEGAMRWPDGPFLFSHGPRASTPVCSWICSRKSSVARRTGKRIVLVLDNGSSHVSKRSLLEIERGKPHVRIFWLPTYSSDKLNDIEALWKHLKEDYFSRMLVKRPENFTRAAIQLLSRMRRPKALRQMLKPRKSQIRCAKS
jgi:transposase